MAMYICSSYKQRTAPISMYCHTKSFIKNFTCLLYVNYNIAVIPPNCHIKLAS